MKMHYKVNANTTIEFEAAKQKDLFKAWASTHEVFGEKKCGLCGSTDIHPVWRTATKIEGKKVETFEFPEFRCNGFVDGENGRQRCGAKLCLGSINDETGTLFPQRRLLPNGKTPGKNDGDKATYGRHNGWTRYKGEAKDNDE